MPPFEEWLFEKLDSVEEIICAVLDKEYELRGKPFREVFESACQLADAVDSYDSQNPYEMDYTMPHVDIAYSSWYLPRRIGDLAPLFYRLFSKSLSQNLRIYDIGCGSGSAFIALLMVRTYLIEKGEHMGELEYIPLDSSPEISKIFESLSAGVIERFGSSVIISSYIHANFTEFDGWKLDNTPNILVMSYLIDIKHHNDTDFVDKTASKISESQARLVMMTTSNSDKKRSILNNIAKLIIKRRADWKYYNIIEPINGLGYASVLTEMRRKWWTSSDLILGNRCRGLFSGEKVKVSWRSEGGNKTSYMVLQF